jgi:ribosomal protein S26
MPAAKRKPRGPDVRPRLKPGHVRCGHCGKQLPEFAAAVFAGKNLHPITCFPAVLEATVTTVKRALVVS